MSSAAASRPAPSGRTIGELLQSGRRALAAAPHAPSTREAALLLARLLDLDEAEVLARDREAVPRSVAERFEALISRRLRGEPVAYLLEEREFYGRRFRVDPRVLIPRPETEHLVEATLRLDLPPAPRLLDVGTGSGVLALTLALELSDARVVATDLSPAALAVAAANRSRHALAGRVHLAACDLATALRLDRFDAVVSNPPYIGLDEAPQLPPDVRDFEPRQALFAGAAGGEIIDRLLAELGPLRPGTTLLLEVAAGQAETVRRRASGSEFAPVDAVPDYAGHERVLVFRHR